MNEELNSEETRDLAEQEAATPADGGGGPSIDDLMESAGLVKETPRNESDEEEAAQLLREEGPQLDGFTEDDHLEIQRSLAERLGMPYVDMAHVHPSAEVLSILDKRLVTRFRVFPISREGDFVRVAFADPYNVVAVQDIQLVLDEKGLILEQCLGDEDEINQAIDRWYTAEKNQIIEMIDEVADAAVADPGTGKKKSAPGSSETHSVSTAGDDDDIATLAKSLENVDVEADEAPLIRLINLIFIKALKMRASDIHFEPYQDEFRIRFRVDGVLSDIESPPQKLQSAMISRLKILSSIDLAEKRIPLDGRIQMNIEGKDIDFRVSTLPSVWGESIVLRLLDKTGLMLGLEEVGFMPDNVALFKKLIKRPNGIILMTGPTGSGKTTTLYSALNSINTVDTKIITVEHPVEYMIRGINQVQVSESVGLTFGLALRTMLRQAPNVILVGEMRDLETAETGIRAALTGHLVFSTLHTNDAPGATTRLIEMGIKPYLVSSALQAVVAQRLVRRICSDCKEMYYPPPAHIEEFGMDPDDFRGQPFYQGIGCHACNFSGYRGRTAIHEIMVLTDDIRAMVLKSAPAEKVRRKAREEGMRTLREDGWQKILKGDTTMEEIMRVTADEITM